jgi:hypothetical protein
MPCTHIRGRNRLALQASRFSHDGESLMRCTKSDARVQAQAEVLGRTRKRGGLHFSTVSSLSRAGYAVVMVPRC